MFCSIVFDILGVVLAVVIVTVSYVKWKYQYWTRRNIPFIKSKMDFSMKNILKGRQTMAESSISLYKEMKVRKLKFCGSNAMLDPILVINDLDLIRNILTKDFHCFTDRVQYVSNKDPFRSNLFSLNGTKWHNLRGKLTPTFTSGKMRYMFPILVNCGEILENVMKEKYENNEALDIKEILSCFTTDIIGSCAFGLDCNTSQNPNSPFRFYGKKLFQPSFSIIIKAILVENFPNLSQFLGINFVQQDVAKFFRKIVSDTIEYRGKNNITRNDFLQLLLNLKNNNQAFEKGDENGNSEVFGLTEIVAQCVLFFVAGSETSSNLMTIALYELGLAQDIQEKVRQEINTVYKKYNNKLTYDGMKEMTYLNQVLEETLRKYPPAPLQRRCIKDYQIPGTHFIIEKNTRIFIPTHGICYDSDYYPEPEKFDPERFNAENKGKRHPYAYIPFGEGPRNCIGLRFGLMQSKVGLISILRNHKIILDTKRMTSPIKFAQVIGIGGQVWLKLEKS